MKEPYIICTIRSIFYGIKYMISDTLHDISWTPKVCTIMALWAVFSGFGPLFYMLWGSG